MLVVGREAESGWKRFAAANGQSQSTTTRRAEVAGLGFGSVRNGLCAASALMACNHL